MCELPSVDQRFFIDFFNVCVGTGFVDWLEKRCVYEKSFGIWICLWQFDCPDLTLCGWPDVKIQLTIHPQGSYGSSCQVYFVSLYMYMWWCVVAFHFQCEHSVQCISNKNKLKINKSMLLKTHTKKDLVTRSWCVCKWWVMSEKWL